MLTEQEKYILNRYFQQATNYYGFLVVNYNPDRDIISFDLAKLSGEFIEKKLPNGKKYVGQRLDIIEKDICSFDATDDNIADFFVEFLHKDKPVVFSGSFIINYEDLIAMFTQDNTSES